MLARPQKLIFVAAAAAALCALGTSAALANTNSTAYWSNNSVVGLTCGDTSGGYVVAAQVYLTAAGSFSSNVDNTFGSGMDNAVKSYQRNHGLSVTGCINGATWSAMQSGTSQFAIAVDCNSSYSDTYYWFTGAHNTAYFNRRPPAISGNWFADTESDPVGGPVVQFTYYRFDDLLVKECGQ